MTHTRGARIRELVRPLHEAGMEPRAIARELGLEPQLVREAVKVLRRHKAGVEPEVPEPVRRLAEAVDRLYVHGVVKTEFWPDMRALRKLIVEHAEASHHQEVARLVGALRKYGMHLDDCAAWKLRDADLRYAVNERACDCGLRDILAEYDGVEQET